MQFLKEEIKNKIIPSSKENGELSEYQYSHNVAYGTVLTIIEYLLEKEKEQIIEANRQGRCNDCPIMYTTLEAQEYYNQTYNQQEDKTFKQKSKWTTQKQHIVDIMKADEADGLYNE